MKSRGAAMLPSVRRDGLRNDEFPIFQLDRIERWNLEDIKLSPRRPRTHSSRQIAQLTAAIREFGECVPLIVDEMGMLLDGYARFEAYKRLGWTEAAVIQVSHLGAVEKRLFALSCNRLAEMAGWDKSVLRIEFEELLILDGETKIELSGFQTVEIDQIIESGVVSLGEQEVVPLPERQATPVTQPGDLWQLGKHRLYCGNALEAESHDFLLRGELAQMSATDMPFNVPVDEDDDVHAWTAVIDDRLSAGKTLATIAVGNNGDQSENRIQVPADCVNALAVGACGNPQTPWQRCKYSSVGPGRSPGLVKPDFLEFGGCLQRPFIVVHDNQSFALEATEGTSFSAPSVLRLGAGLRAHFGTNLSILAIRALLIHTTEPCDHPSEEAGRGRVARSVENIVLCDDDTVRVVYQGTIAPTRYIRAPIPVPSGSLPGKVTVTAIRAHKVDVVVVYKVDRLTRALSDFAKIVEVFDGQGVSFVSVTQQFNTTTSMGRLTLNVLLSFAQFEREVTGERIRDKIAASKKKGLFMGGGVPLGYDVVDHRLVVNEVEAATVRTIFSLYVKLRCARRVQAEAIRLGIVSKIRTSGSGRKWGGARLSRGHIYYILKNRTYLGEIAHKGHIYDGQHEAIVDRRLWDQVQGILTNNVRDRSSGKGFANPSLLTGVLFDAQGNRLTPSHTQRGSVRYRYYVSQAYIQNQPENAGTIKRVSAIEIEELVARQVREIFLKPERLVQQLLGEGLSGEAKQSAFAAIARIGDQLDDGDDKRLAPLSRSVISRVVVDVEAVTITFDRQALNAQLGLAHRESERESAQSLRNGADREFTVVVPVRLTRLGRQKRMIIGDDKGQQQAVVNDSMLLAVARAITWDQEIRGGASLRQIAKRENVSAGYVTRIAPLAFLAPDIVQAIYEGRQPAGLKVKTLSANLPLEWAEQRRVLGFPTL